MIVLTEIFSKLYFSNKNVVKFLISLLVVGALASCDDLDDDEGSSNTYDITMCTEISGNTLSAGCTSASCESGESSNGIYKNYSDCASDVDYVLNNWRDNSTLIQGPNSGGSSGSGSGSGSGGGSCNMNTVWSGSSDSHAKYYCLDACNWINIDNENTQQAVQINCSSLAGFNATGSCNISC